MHPLLNRQFKKIYKEDVQISPELDSLLRAVSITYENNDKDRELLERSFTISSREFSELNTRITNLAKDLEIEKKNVEEKVSIRTEELQVANKRLTELDKVKTEFISVAAHQLRTPLSAVKWILSLLMDEDNENMTAAQRSLIMKGYESNERIIRLINQMLIVTRIESGRMTYSFISIHIEDLIDNCLQDFTGEIKNRNINLRFEEDEHTLPYVNIDADKVRAVIQNLIENAIFYTKDNGNIIVKAKQDGSYLKISVKDDGIGIPDVQKTGIFNKFFRAENALKARTEGSGLGLFVSKSIVEKHGGNIWFDSVEGEGSTFYFTLPFNEDNK